MRTLLRVKFVGNAFYTLLEPEALLGRAVDHDYTFRSRRVHNLLFLVLLRDEHLRRRLVFLRAHVFRGA